MRLMRRIYRIVWDYPVHWRRYSWSRYEMSAEYWSGERGKTTPESIIRHIMNEKKDVT